jgi:hypothetical protein
MELSLIKSTHAVQISTGVFLASNTSCRGRNFSIYSFNAEVYSRINDHIAIDINTINELHNVRSTQCNSKFVLEVIKHDNIIQYTETNENHNLLIKFKDTNGDYVNIANWSIVLRLY